MNQNDISPRKHHPGFGTIFPSNFTKYPPFSVQLPIYRLPNSRPQCAPRPSWSDSSASTQYHSATGSTEARGTGRIRQAGSLLAQNRMSTMAIFLFLGGHSDVLVISVKPKWSSQRQPGVKDDECLSHNESHFASFVAFRRSYLEDLRSPQLARIVM